MFPRVPKISGSTDDENSIHLNSKVGPANPLPLRNYNQINNQVMKILNDSNNNDFFKKRKQSVISKNEADYLNINFERFKKNEKVFEELNSDDYNDESDDQSDSDSVSESESEIESDSDEEIESTQNTKETDHKIDQKTNQKSTELPSKSLLTEFQKIKFKSIRNENSKTIIKYSLVIIIPVLLIIAYFSIFKTTSYKPISNLQEINHKFENLEYKINNINKQNKMLTETQNQLINEIDSIRDSINTKIKKIENLLVSVEGKNKNLDFNKLNNDIEKINELFNSKNGLNVKKLNNIEIEIDSIKLKLNNLEKIQSNLNNLQQKIKQDILNELPNHIPVIIKDKKIQFLPEFSKFLTSFIEQYNSKNPIMHETNGYTINREISWDEFLNQNEINLNKYIKDYTNELKLITKNEFERFIMLKLKENNEFFNNKLNKIIESSKLTSSETINENYLKELVEKFKNQPSASQPSQPNQHQQSQQISNKVNYADFKLGSKILGYITSSTIYHKNRSLLGKIVLGWYDFLNNKDNKFNANNILVDGGNYWLTNPSNSMVGIRLSDSIIITDLIIKNPIINNQMFQNSSVYQISLFVKPLENEGKLIEMFPSQKTHNKKEGVPKSFIRIQDFRLDETAINHLKISSNFVNLKIPVKDIVIKIYNNHGNNMFTSLYNVKVYGYNELDSYFNNNEIMNDLLNEKKIGEIKNIFDDIPLGRDEPF